MAYEPKQPPVNKGRHLYKHGFSGTPLYGRWRRMVQRCTDQKCKEFKHYGGRGIQVCERWRSFENFLADMGEPPHGLTLERNRKDGNYEPSNCCWADSVTQAQNKRNNVLIEFNGVTQCRAEWARQLGLPVKTLKSRIDAGWPLERALTSMKYLNNGKAR